MAAFNITLPDDVQYTLFMLCKTHWGGSGIVTRDNVLSHTCAAILDSLLKSKFDPVVKYAVTVVTVTNKVSRLINFKPKMGTDELVYYAAVQLREQLTNGEKTHYVYTYIRDPRPKMVVVNGAHMFVDPQTGKHSTVVMSYDRKTMHALLPMTEQDIKQDKLDREFFTKWLEHLGKEDKGVNHVSD